MYELVNTSLPNGLIAGTHGFATVAMTKGVQDVLRGRLEALCAYTHRTSVHDASYYQQNPVNWFHVMLPQGEHVIGRVAPSDFDYTGRTNRLARIRVFGANEMPGVGGAEILAKERHWFAQPWVGEPRYLDEDKNTCSHLRTLNPKMASNAPAWDAVFGSGGSRYAQQVAWQIEKNLIAGGKAIYFKTSTAWDVSGEKLLGLFVDVVNLLPVELRARVTFSTYPVSLPVGTGCNLRGIYDRDKFFDASSATQAWVDCENAKIVHEELLPTSGILKSTGASSEKSEWSVGGGADDHPQVGSTAPKLGIRRSQGSGGDPYAYRNLIAPQKNGPDMFIVGLVVAGAVVLLAAGGFFFWMMQHNKQQMKDSGAAAAVEAEIKSIESEKEQQERLAKEKRDAERKDAIERAEKESAEKEAAARRAKAEQEADAAKRNLEREKAANAAKAEAERAAEKAMRDAENRRKQKTAFMTASVQGKGTPPKPKTGLANAMNDPETFKVYYYCDGGVTLTNELAGFKPINAPGNKKKIIDYSLYVREPKCKLTPLEKSPIVLWLSKGNVWFDWGLHEAKRGLWFKEHESHDLQMECFGVSDDVFEVWNKAFPVTYLVTWGEEDGQSVEWKSREFKMKDAVDVVCKAEIDRLKKAVEKAEKDIVDNEEEIKTLKKEIAVLDDQLVEYSTETNKLAKLKADLKALRDDRQTRKKAKKFDDKAEEEFKNEQRELNKQITGQEAVVEKMNIKPVEIKAYGRKQKLKQREDGAEALKQKLEKKKLAYEMALKDPDREKQVRESSFGVEVKGVN